MTGIGFWGLLGSAFLGGSALAVGNLIAHGVTPVMTVVLFLAVGPRDWIRGWMVPASLLVPLAWGTLTMVRGQATGEYPYPFMDVAALGPARVLATSLFLTAVGVAFTLVYWWLDARRTP